ncbi:beta-lactamase/transpeptidase-like protein [Mycena rebaudengoi]|nr:beta-lactamase/transpeptidase-like protein [Mycena rebaudengoi]
MPSRSFLSLAFFCITTVVVAPSPNFDSQQPLYISKEASVLTPHIDAAIADILQAFQVPGGVGVAVVHKDAHGSWVLESKGYGNASSDGLKKVTADTLFAMGSNSKLFDILATGLLISNETLTPRVSWTSKIATLIPDWKLMDPVATSESTIVDLMSHRTGLPRHDLMSTISDTIPDILARFQYLRPSTGFREHYQYNNHMYTTLSYLPPVLLNMTFENYVHKNILKPLGMDHTTYFYADAIKTGHLADSFARDGANVTENPFSQGTIRTLPFWDQSENETHQISGAGGVISSAHDMAIWLQMLLTEGKNQWNETVIPSEVIREVAIGVSVREPVARYPELSPVVYGGGQMRGTYRGYEFIEHGGSVPGFLTQVTRFPHENLGVAVLSNDDNFGSLIMESVKYRILDSLLRLEPIDWTARQAILASYVPFLIIGFRFRAAEEARARMPPPNPRPKDAEPPSAPFATITGTYKNLGYGTLNFCLFTLNTTTNSESCDRIAAEVPTILPGVIDPDVPTFIAKWDTEVTNYARLAHYSGNVFNMTGLLSLPTDVAGQFWVKQVIELVAELGVEGNEIGFAMFGLWGEGARVGPRKGDTLQERAEVWFSKV